MRYGVWGSGCVRVVGLGLRGWGVGLRIKARPVLGMMGGTAASEQSGNISNGFEDFDLKVKNRIWP